VKTSLPPSRLPYLSTGDRIEEDKLQSVGEVADLRPGASGQLRLRLKAGTYVLLCNEPGHYRAGMTSTLVVKP